MAIRVLLTPLFGTEEDRRALTAASVVATRFSSHITALLVEPDPVDTIPIVGEGVSADTIRRLTESAAAAINQRRRSANAVFNEICQEAEIAIVESADMSSGQPSAGFYEATGESEDIVPERALFSDLVVFAGASSVAARRLQATFETVLLKSRCPILLAPMEPAEPIARTIAIAWNGTPEAKSALNAAMPFIESSVAVHLLTVTSARTDTDTLERARDYLGWHGIGSEAHVIEASGDSAGAALVAKASLIDADLLVMGGYGHARLRERILGGVTRHIVGQQELPILLAH